MGGFRLLLPQHARARALSHRPYDQPPRRRAGCDRPLCGRPFVRRLGHECQRWDGRGSRSDRGQPLGLGAAERIRAGQGCRMSTPSLSDPLVEPASIAAEPLGQPIRGPRALGDSWPRFWHLAYNIARSEFKLKFFGSALGYLWQVVRPLLLFGVLYVFFVLVFHVDKAKGAAAHYYGAQLLGSIVLFTFFGEATG